jgi:hypothetical protein
MTNSKIICFSILIILYCTCASASFRELVNNCDHIYKKGLDHLDVASSVKNSVNGSDGNGLMFVAAIDDTNQWRNTVLIAVYGVDDCRQNSAARRHERCFWYDPPTLSVLLKSKKQLQVTSNRPIIGSLSRITVPLEDSLWGAKWFKTFPKQISELVAITLEKGYYVYEYTCDWYVRPKAG